MLAELSPDPSERASQLNGILKRIDKNPSYYTENMKLKWNLIVLFVLVWSILKIAVELDPHLS